MRKEVLIAISFGLVVGLIITIGMYRARTALEVPPPEDPNSVSDNTVSPQATPTSPIDTGLIVREPVEEALSNDATIQVSGSTFPSRTIVILLNEKEVVGSSDIQGNFSIPITLTAGANIVRVRVLNPGQDSSETVRTVVYESAQSAALVPDTATASATPSAKTKK